MDNSFQIVLFCAEDDDLELVDLVHRGRQRGIELQVAPGVECSDGPIVKGLDRAKFGLFVILRSENLPRHRESEIQGIFERIGRPTQTLMLVTLDLAHPEETLRSIEERFRLVADDGDLPTKHAANRQTADFSAAPPELVERAEAATMFDAPVPDTDPTPRRRRPLPYVAGGVLTLGMALGVYYFLIRPGNAAANETARPSVMAHE